MLGIGVVVLSVGLVVGLIFSSTEKREKQNNCYERNIQEQRKSREKIFVINVILFQLGNTIDWMSSIICGVKMGNQSRCRFLGCLQFQTLVTRQCYNCLCWVVAVIALC